MKESTPRYAFVDALRGVAALGVLLAHLVTNEISGETLKNILPTAVKEFCFQGHFGVEVFFVLSGFVIALSLSQKPLTWAGGLNFALRRQVRLDPPYFVAVAIMMALHGWFGRGYPNPLTTFLNLIYAHNLAGVPQILGVAWTLCLEIQFYAAFLTILALDWWLGKPKDAPFSGFAVTIVCLTALVSCVLVQRGTPPQLYALGQYSWFYFAAGVLCFWCWRGWAPMWTFGLVVLGMNLSALWAFFARDASFVSASFQGIETGLVTAMLLFALAGKGKLETVTLGRVGQNLGRISYSLYLTHAMTVEGVAWLARAVWGATPVGALLGLALAFPLALVVAHIFYLAVESPSMRWATRFKRV